MNVREIAGALRTKRAVRSEENSQYAAIVQRWEGVS